MEAKVKKELFNLAAKRVSKSLNSVIQLMESQDDNLELQLFIMSALANEFARHLQKVTAIDMRIDMPEEAAKMHILTMLADAIGVGCAIVSPEDAAKAGVKFDVNDG